MKLVQCYGLLQQQLEGHFTTRQLAETTRSSLSSASKCANRLAALDLVVKVGRGKWVDANRVSRLALAEFLAEAPAYITAHTALFHHGMIEQIPRAIYAGTSGRGGTFRTPYGAVNLYQIAPALFTGWRMDKACAGVKIASPEKALVDYFYLGLTGAREFGTLPELELPENFSWEKAFAFVALISNKAWRSAVRRRLEQQAETCLILSRTDSAEADIALL